jgi:hypothetical protein
MTKQQIILTKILWFSIGFTLAVVLIFISLQNGKF